MILSVRNLYFKYADKNILNDISFDFERGKTLGILGQNGVGKSTLFKCILGFLKVDSGKIEIDNKDIEKLSLKERALKIAYIPQSHYPTFNHSVINIVEMGVNARLSGFSSPSYKDREKAYKVLKLMGIEKLYNRGYKEISGGERQLTLIARALMQDAKILMMDEPTSNLDYGNQIKVLETCKDLNSMGYTVIQTTHNPEQAFVFFDEVLIMHNHKVLEKGKVEDVMTEENLKKIYGVDISIGAVENVGERQYVLIPKYKRRPLEGDIQYA